MGRCRSTWAGVPILVVALFSGCLSAAGNREDGLTVFAAASLSDAMADLSAAYEAETAATIMTSLDASSTLRAQIENGAPADVFLSADTTNPELLVAAGRTQGPVRVFARNSLAIVVPSANPAGISSPTDLAREGVRVVAAGDEVPITRYARQLIRKVAASPSAPRAFAQRVERNVVSREDNARAVLAKIELGEGDAAIVYASDAAASDRIETVRIPDDHNVTAAYGALALTAGEGAASGEPFIDWLLGQEGQAILARYGFLPPP